MEELRIGAPSADRDTDRVIDLVSKTFGRYWKFRRYCYDGYIVGAPYDWSVSRIGISGDDVVSHFGVWDFTMRVGISRIRLGGIGAVATHDDYRNQGVMRRTVQESLIAQRDSGYDLTFLFGIQDFYNKYGYRRAWNDMTVSISREAIQKLPEFDRGIDATTFQAQGIDIQAFAEAYNRRNESTTGTFVRPTYGTNRNPTDWQISTWQEENEGLCYLIYELGHSAISVIDWAGSPKYVLAGLFSLLAEHAISEARFLGLPLRSPLGRSLKKGDAEFSGRFVRQGGAMARILKFGNFVEKLCPEFSARLARSGFANYTGNVTLTLTGVDEGIADVGETPSREEQVTLGIDTGTVAVIPPAESAPTIRGGQEMVQLLLGSEGAEELLAGGTISATPEVEPLLYALFPVQEPTIPSWDRF